ncbi:CLUMA_CG010245, isoform A [Clunio marinus]|uniref:CLUMA_CG010245, isoform A n=1 Tax=Clunio marinus TaxID=568069 RepID=A0A1J1IAM0_9DIPT|nr:CLUMA_CG010245, isoform A [Clunio marinus]
MAVTHTSPPTHVKNIMLVSSLTLPKSLETIKSFEASLNQTQQISTLQNHHKPIIIKNQHKINEFNKSFFTKKLK